MELGELTQEGVEGQGDAFERHDIVMKLASEATDGTALLSPSPSSPSPWASSSPLSALAQAQGRLELPCAPFESCLAAQHFLFSICDEVSVCIKHLVVLPGTTWLNTDDRCK